MIEDYHFIYSQWNGLLHICLPEPPSTTPGVMHRKFGLKHLKDFSARTYGALLPESWTVVRADKYVKVHSIGNI